MKKSEILNFALTLLVALSAAFAAEAKEPDTWWVNAKNYIEGLTTPEEYAALGFDGTTPEKGFGTIQIGVDKSVEGDTINVKEGVYDKGSTVEWNNNTRVVVSGKNVTIVGVDGWQKTFIVGHQTFGEEGDDGRGNGPNAVRCVAAKGSMRMSNFTICSGATICADPSTGTTYCGGGVTADGTSCVFTDCMISNNICARFGSGAHKGKYLRCRFVKNTALTKGAATYAVLAFSCVFSGNNNISGTYSELEGSGSGQFLNCTIVGNPDPTFGASTGWNCVFSMNGNEKKIDATKIFATVTSADSPFQLVSAPCGDFRLIPQATAIGAGEMAYLTTEQPFDPSDPDGKIRDLNGNVIDTTAATLNAGACQEVVTPAYGGVLFDSQANVNGLECYGSNLTFATSWPVLLKVKPGSTAFRCSVTGSKPSDLNSRLPYADGTFDIVPPHAAGVVQTNALNAVGSSKQFPRSGVTTIQGEVDSHTSNSTLYLISVAEGDYASGGVSVRGVTNRFCLQEARNLHYVATGDVDKTIIRGAVSANPRDDENYPGCGPDAVRCVNFSYSNASTIRVVGFRGFTFADGRTDCGQSAGNDRGAAAFGRNTGSQRTALVFTDCVFTNCWAPDAGIGVYARFVRCKFIDCGSAGVGFVDCVLSSCTFENCDFKGGTFGEMCLTVNCTDASGNAVSAASGQWHLNSNFGFGTVFPPSAQVFGATANGFFADVANGDFRPISGSEALDASRRAFPQAVATYASCAANFAGYAARSLDSDSWTFGGGFPVAGAYMDWATGVTFLPNAYPEWYTFVGGKALLPGESVSISRTSTAVRHVGIVANGVTNMLDNGAYVYTQPADGGMNDGALVGILDQSWYVNPDPTVGDDEANGFTPQTAKWTLAGVLSVATNAGDVVHAAAGVYKDGKMHYSDAYGDSRAVIEPNVALLGEGPDKSIIRGERNPDGGTYYQGEGAMRCVMLKSGALVSGFTLTNGHSSVTGSGSSSSSAYNGTAAWGSDVSSTYVVNCRLTDSRSNSGAALHVSLFDCVVDNVYGNYGSISYCKLYGCYVNNCRSHSSTALVYRPYECFDTTIGPKNTGSGSMLAVTAGDKPVLVNTLALGACPIICYTNETGVTLNCAFVGTRPEEGDTTVDSIFVKSADDFKLDTDVRPLPRESPLVGEADETRMPSNARAKELLLALRAARKLNAGLDIGAYEADWKSAYAQDIANRGLTVTTVSSDVVESADRTVVLGDGMGLSGVWRGKGTSNYRYELRFKVNGAGSLSVTVNGETRTFGSGVWSWSFDSALAANDISFAYAGDGMAEILKGARMSGLVLIVR